MAHHNKRQSCPNAGIVAVVKSDEPNQLIKEYNAAFGKPGNKPPIVNKAGQVEFMFPLKGEAETFFTNLAKKGFYFTVIDRENHAVMAYSNSNSLGSLYHGNGTLFKYKDCLISPATKVEKNSNSTNKPGF